MKKQALMLTWKNSIGIQVLPDVNITFHDGVVDRLMNATWLHTQERWLEKGFWATETLITNSDDLEKENLA